jgi:hypothetical protein
MPFRHFVELDGDDAAGDRAFHRSGEARRAGQKKVQGAEQIGVEAGAEHQGGDIGHGGRLRRKSKMSCAR